ncbi:MAG: threonylcarbamoyl-AMP synthase [Myxococcales bacterium]|nr:threonylcarbamoyl-AMP synthase [Myxococcales bacterium]
MLLNISAEHPEPHKIARAARILANGGVIAYPTDTVYGLGCDPLNRQAIDRLFQMKSMPRTKPLALICKDLSDIAKYAVVENAEYRLLKRFLPGPYCFVLRATRDVPRMLQSKQKTVGIRVPKHPVTRALVEALGRPLLSTTAAAPDDPEPLVDPWAIDETFPMLDLVLEAGPCGSTATTVVDLSGGDVRVLREGAGPVHDLLQ